MPAPIRNLDYIVLMCSRMAETRAFYLETMKFEIDDDRPNWITFRVGSGLLALKRRGPGIAWNDGPVVPGSAAVQLAFRVPPPAIADWHAELVAKGVPIVSPPMELPHARHLTLFFRDPEDNIIELYAEI